jgi:predicted permease
MSLWRGFREARMRVGEFFSKQRQDRELAAEIESHIQMQIDDHLRAGMAPEEARRQALIKFGGVEQMKENCRDRRGLLWLESLLQDVRFGLRMLRKSPGFTAVAILTLALGIGANTALFTVVNGVLLNPLPFPEPDRLVTVDASKTNFQRGSISYPNFIDWHRINQSFSYFAVSRPTGFLMTGIGPAEELDAAAVTSDLFPMLGIKPVVGRWFTPAEDAIGTSKVVAISTELWQRKFGLSRDVIGKAIALDGKDYVIAGVFPGHLDLPMRYFGHLDVYIPLGEFASPWLKNRSAGLGIHGIARLKPGVTIEEARADMKRLTGYLGETYPDVDKGTGATLIPLKESMVGRVRPFLLMLLGAVGVVLLIACVNVANLMLARSSGRTREMAVRSVLGAGTARLVRQGLTESLLLAALGGALGIALASAGTRAALAALPATLPRAGDVGMDARVLALSVVLTLGVGVLFGLLPAIRTALGNSPQRLKEGGRSVSESKRGMQAALVTVQMALALVLLAGAGLLIRSLTHLWSVDPGFDPGNVLTFDLALPPQLSKASPAMIRATLRNFDSTIAAVTGVKAEALSWGAFPMDSEDDTYFWIEGQPVPPSVNEMNATLSYTVGPNYLKAMRIPLLSGRFLSDSDDEHAKPVAVVDEVFARTYFPHGDALGKTIYVGGQTNAFEIVGIVGHVKQWGLDSDDTNSLRAQAYFAFMQMPDEAIALVPSNTEVVVRSGDNIPGLADSIRRASGPLSRDEVISNVQTMHQIIEASLASRRFAMMLLGTFAAVALLLAGIGLYGVTAYAASRCTHEIGIRMALGAHPWEVFQMVLGQGLQLALAGVAIGAIAAAVLTRLVSGFSALLYGVGGNDPVTLFVVALVLMVVAALACWIPARRAMGVDPMVALRYE